MARFLDRQCVAELPWRGMLGPLAAGPHRKRSLGGLRSRPHAAGKLVDERRRLDVRHPRIESWEMTMPGEVFHKPGIKSRSAWRRSRHDCDGNTLRRSQVSVPAKFVRQPVITGAGPRGWLVRPVAGH
jgi:hypothetical protein